MGQWRLHVPNRQAVDVVADGSIVYAAFNSGVLEYDINASESSIWDKVNGLSDITISCLGYEPNLGSVVVGYTNGNIDVIKGTSVTNIPGIVLAQIQGDNRIYKIVEKSGFVYAATGFGIVKIDVDKNEIKDTYYPTNGLVPILDVAFMGDSIYAITGTKMYAAKRTNPALADPMQWNVDSRIPEILVATREYKEIECVNNELYVQRNETAFGNDTVFKVTNSGLTYASVTNFSIEIKSIGQIDNMLLVNCADVSILYNANNTYNTVFDNYASEGNCNINKAVKINGEYWLADNNIGLVKYIPQLTHTKIPFEGPPKNEFYAMDWNKGKLAIVPGGKEGLIPSYRQPSVFHFEDEMWSSQMKDDQPIWASNPTHDNISVALNPKNDNEIAIGTFSEYGLFIGETDGQITTNFDDSNSTLESSTNDWILLSDLEYDSDGNLWILNGNASKPLKLYTAEHEWFEFAIGNGAINKQTRCMVIDYNNNIWMAAQDKGLFGYKPGASITDPSDDQLINLLDGETNGALPSVEITAIAVDFDNEIWIGTDNGFAVLYNSDGAFDAGAGQYNAQRIKVTFEGNVEYILGNTYITDIEVDGANRKWFGTSNSGLILLSADGQEIISTFTTDNSPIISNTIIDLEINHTTGEVFIITDKGLVSYRSDASYEDPEYSDVQIFPNPARPEFDGPITIQGIRYDSDIHITDVAGNLVYKTTSNGGTATWNGKTIQGQDVVSGVYLIWTTPNQTKGRYVGKVLVVN